MIDMVVILVLVNILLLDLMHGIEGDSSRVTSSSVVRHKNRASADCMKASMLFNTSGQSEHVCNYRVKAEMATTTTSTVTGIISPRFMSSTSHAMSASG
jgi:hypothetical protein